MTSMTTNSTPTDQTITFRIAKDLSYGERYYKICTNARSFWYLNKKHIHRDYVVKTLYEISKKISKKNATAIFIVDGDLAG